MATAKAKPALKTKRVVEEEIAVKKAKVRVKRTIEDIEDAVVKQEKLRPAAKEKSGVMDYLALLEEVSNVVKLNSVSLSEESRMHSGLLGIDLVLGRGIGPTMCTIFGPEQSAKTTLAITIMAATINQGVPISTLWDAEQSSGSSSDYIQNILNEQGITRPFEEVFGVRKKGVWTIKPLVYYQDSAVGEDFFNWLHALLKRLPDKRFDNDQWWYVYENTKPNQTKYLAASDKVMNKANHGIWVPAKDDSLQAVIIVDSYPSLMPLAQDEDEHTKAMAVQARMFALQLPRVKGSFRAKRIALIGINQLRLNPGARFGNPETEPGGQALKFFSDQRMRVYPRALSGVPFHPKGEGMIEKEPSVNGEGEDTYRNINCKTIKNKLSVPQQEMWLRLWVSDSEGEARGYDLVWDTFYSCFLCGIITGKRRCMRLNIPGLGEAKRNIDWMQFKKLIIGTPEQRASICGILGYKTVNLRRGLVNLSKKGALDALYWEAKQAKGKTKGAASADDTDDDDDEDADEDAE